jgi:hypothetical protein
LSDDSLIRFDIAAERVRTYDPAADESALDYAFDTLYRADGDRRGTPSAQWSIVFDAEQMRISFRTKRAPQIRSIDLDKIDFSCDAPRLMLDIHEDLQGDISQAFEPYSHERSVDQFAQFFKAWQMDVSWDDVQDLVQHLEAFPCGEGQASPGQVLPSPSAGDGNAVSTDTRGTESGLWWLAVIATGGFVSTTLLTWRVLRKRGK